MTDKQKGKAKDKKKEPVFRPEYLAPLDEVYGRYEITDAERYYDDSEESFIAQMFDDEEPDE